MVCNQSCWVRLFGYYFKLLRCIKIGKPNINCTYIPLNPTYYKL